MLIKIGDCWVDPNEIAMIVDGDDPRTILKPMICVHLRGGGSTWIHAAMDEAEAALIDAGVIEDDGSEADGPELTEEEHEIAKALFEEGFEFLARDADGKLYAFRHEPTKSGPYWDDNEETVSERPQRIESGFDFIDAADEAPWSISILLRE